MTIERNSQQDPAAFEPAAAHDTTPARGYHVRMRRSMPALAAGVAVGAAAALWAVAQRAPRESFRDRVVLLTGGARGLGLELARLFADEGAYIAIVARDLPALLEVKEELRERGAADVDAFVCDVTNRRDAERAVDRLIARWGRIDVLVNNAGIILSAPMERMQLEDYERAMAIHFWAPLYLIRAVSPHMRRQREGRIVNIASIGGKVAVPHLLPYCASKFALVGLSDGMRAELARHHVAVTTVTPGLMRTGSHVNARFKGRHALEFAWFALADALPLTSINAARAARQIVEAARRRQSSLTITTQARVLAALNTLAPAVVGTAMALTNRLLLPRSGGVDAQQEKSGLESRPRWLPSLITILADRAAERNNELKPDRRTH